MTDDNIVSCRDLTYEYTTYDEENNKQKLTALDRINVDIKKGEFVAVLGHNGSGKSTFAKNINALLFPTSGEIIVNGLDTKKEENIWDIRKHVGMVFQNPDNQIIATTVEDDVAFGLENIGIERVEMEKRIDQVLTWVGMEEFRKNAPNLLSGGQKQRVAIAGVLAMKPNCIVMDEPTAMLDPMGRKEVLEAIIRLNKEEKITIVLITHFMEEAVQADRVIVMDNGNVIMDDIPRNVFSRVEEIKKVGLDVPQVTEVAFLLRQRGIDLPDGILSVEEMVGEICRLG